MGLLVHGRVASLSTWTLEWSPHPPPSPVCWEADTGVCDTDMKRGKPGRLLSPEQMGQGGGAVWDGEWDGEGRGARMLGEVMTQGVTHREVEVSPGP